MQDQSGSRSVARPSPDLVCGARDVSTPASLCTMTQLLAVRIILAVRAIVAGDCAVVRRVGSCWRDDVVELRAGVLESWADLNEKGSGGPAQVGRSQGPGLLVGVYVRAWYEVPVDCAAVRAEDKYLRGRGAVQPGHPHLGGEGRRRREALNTRVDVEDC